jgi:hypothetical protein
MSFEKIPDGDNKYESLKKGLLDGTISLLSLRDKLIEFDQLTPGRDASPENLKFLYDPEIIKFIKDAGAVEGYSRLLSFTEFHVAQRKAEKNAEEAIAHFQKALESAQVDKTEGSWVAYVEGTLLYMQGKEIPEELILKVSNDKNISILKKFNKGLKQRGYPSYKEDYYI